MQATGKLVSSILCLVLATSGFSIAGDRILEVGKVRMIVADTGALRQISVGRTQMIRQLFLTASCKDKSIKGDRRLWQHSHDTAKPGVTIAEDKKRNLVVITREGALAYGPAESDKAIAYRQRIEVSMERELTCHYEVEILRRLKWGPSPASVALEIPVGLAAGKPCVLNRAEPRIVPEVWSKEQQVVGRFSALKLQSSPGQTLEVTPGAAEMGQLSDARAWGNFPYLYLSVAKKGPWFGGAKPLATGTKWEINFALRLPPDTGTEAKRAGRALPAPPARQAGARAPVAAERVLFSDGFNRASLGNAWRQGRVPKKALDRYNRIEILGHDRMQPQIQGNALDLYHSGKRGSCSIRSTARNLPCRCVIEYDFTIKAGDTHGQTRHSMYLRSHADPGTCLCLHVDKAKQWWFFEFKNRGKWVGERLFYYPFRYTFPPVDVAFHVRIESYGNGTLAAWLTGGGIPSTAMPVAINSVRSWTPFDDGELVFVSTHRGADTLCHSQWDNVRVSTLAPRPTINELYYRDKLLVEFGHYRFVPEGSWVRVDVRRKGEKLRLLSDEVKPLVPDESRLLFDTSSLPKGHYVVTGRLFDKTGKPIGESSVDFEKVRDPQLELEQMKVYVDEDNRIVADGKPFFPIGLYCVGLRGAKRWTTPHELFVELKAAGFNTVQNYSLGGWNLDEKRFDSFVQPWLDGAAKHGLKVYFDVEGPEGHVRRRRGSIRDITDPLHAKYDAPAEVAWRVKKIMNHPALLCWYTADEPICHGRTVEELARQNRMIKSLDPHHPTVIATCRGGEHCGGYRKCCQAVDILATDHYPMPKEPAHAFRRTAIKGKRAVQGLQAHWTIPQCYSRGREMTEEEIRLETYLSIVHGAKGIIWWACIQCKTDHPRCCEATKKLATELSRISPILLDEDCDQTVGLDPPDAAIDVLLKRHDGKRYLIAVNHTAKSIGKVTFGLPNVTSCKSYFDGARRAIAGGTSFTDAFAPYQVRMYEVR
jgi:hypothetical protein